MLSLLPSLHALPYACKDKGFNGVGIRRWDVQRMETVCGWIFNQADSSTLKETGTGGCTLCSGVDSAYGIYSPKCGSNLYVVLSILFQKVNCMLRQVPYCGVMRRPSIDWKLRRDWLERKAHALKGSHP